MQSILNRQKKLLQKIQKQEQEDLSKKKDILGELKRIKIISIILCYGGNFSIGVYKENVNIFHKSDHKYVCRKKQGQRQINKDKSNKAQSMGSQIRRENENIHQNNIIHILNEVCDYLNDSDLIFIQAPGLNKLMLLQNNPILFQNLHKIKSLSLTSKKANYSEISRIFKNITTVKLITQNSII